MNEENLDGILEAALHARIAARCQRAYVHETRNGLQGIYGGFAAIGRVLKGLGTDKFPVDRTLDLTRQAIKNHEQALERILGNLTLQMEVPTATSVGEMLREVTQFLNNDASARQVRLRITSTVDTQVILRPHRLRLVLLSLIVDSIDWLNAGGELHLQVMQQEAQVHIDLIEKPVDNAMRDQTIAWQIDFASAPQFQALILPVVHRLVRADGGELEYQAHTQGGRKIGIRYRV